MKNKIAIIGFGYVGKAMLKIFPDALIYDPLHWNADESQCTELGRKVIEEFGVTLAKRDGINSACGLSIICVPTPMQETESEFKPVDTSIVEDVISWLQTDLILIKSTVPPGTTDRLCRETGKNICFSPEYVGEGKYQITEWQYMSATNPRTHDFQIIGGAPNIRDRVCNYFIKELGPEKTYYLIDAVEAEIIKYMENAWGAMKVIFSQEMWELCQLLGASYIRVREGWALDNRVERMHTAVFVGDQGFAGKCYPKDLNGIVALGDTLGAEMSLIKATLRKNRKVAKD